jgi:hypothetical protein
LPQGQKSAPVLALQSFSQSCRLCRREVVLLSWNQKNSAAVIVQSCCFTILVLALILYGHGWRCLVHSPTWAGPPWSHFSILYMKISCRSESSNISPVVLGTGDGIRAFDGTVYFTKKSC